MSTDEFFCIEAYGTNNNFLLITKAGSMGKAGDLTSIPNDPGLKKGFYTTPYTGPSFRYDHGHITTREVRNVSGKTGWILKTDREDNFWQILGDESIQKRLGRQPYIDMVSCQAKSAELIVQVLQLCNRAASLILTVRSSFMKKTSFVRPRISFPNLTSLTVRYDDKSKLAILKTHSILEFFDVSKLEYLSINRVPLNSTMLRGLCCASLTTVNVCGLSDTEFEVLFATLHARDVKLGSFKCICSKVPSKFELSPLHSVMDLWSSEMTLEDSVLLLKACKSSLKLFTLTKPMKSDLEFAKLFNSLAINCTKLEDLRIYHWKNYTYSKHEELCDVWAKSGRKPLQNVEFDENIGYKFFPLKEPFYYGETESRLAETLTMVPSYDERTCANIAHADPYWVKKIKDEQEKKRLEQEEKERAVREEAERKEQEKKERERKEKEEKEREEKEKEEKERTENELKEKEEAAIIALEKRGSEGDTSSETSNKRFHHELAGGLDDDDATLRDLIETPDPSSTDSNDSMSELSD